LVPLLLAAAAAGAVNIDLDSTVALDPNIAVKGVPPKVLSIPPPLLVLPNGLLELLPVAVLVLCEGNIDPEPNALPKAPKTFPGTFSAILEEEAKNGLFTAAGAAAGATAGAGAGDITGADSATGKSPTLVVDEAPSALFLLSNF